MTDNAATVTYFRTTLDPLDLYRIDRIINHLTCQGCLRL